MCISMFAADLWWFMEKEIAINSYKCMDVARIVIIHGVTEKGVQSHIVSWFQTLTDTSITLMESQLPCCFWPEKSDQYRLIDKISHLLQISLWPVMLSKKAWSPIIRSSKKFLSKLFRNHRFGGRDRRNPGKRDLSCAHKQITECSRQ